MAGYTKLFSDIVTSSIWNEDDKTRIVWITLLALSDAKGYVHCAEPSLALMARVSPEDCAKAVKILEGPDVYSRTPDDEGKRVTKCNGGWIILNYEKHRNRLSDDSTAFTNRERVKRYRERQKDVTGNVTCRNTASASAYASVSDIPSALNTPEFQKAWENWQQHRKEIKKPLTVKSVEMQMKEFVAWGPAGAVEAIEHTIKMGWQGIRRPDRETSRKPSRKSYVESKTVIRDRAVTEIVLSLEASKKSALDTGDYQNAINAMSDKYRDMPGVLKEALEIIKGRQRSLVKV